MRHPRPNKGFTLVEMVVIIIIMAVMSGVAVPAYSRFQERVEFDGRVGQITGFLSQARAQAIDLGMQIEVQFDPQTETFVASGTATVVGGDIPTDLSSTTETTAVEYYRELSIPTDYRIADMQVFGPEALTTSTSARGAVVIYFREDGTCDGLRFTLIRDATHDAATITLWPTTGAVDVEPAESA
jgi:prepilin-type N-terminal cleavage/methylation domain-containing protein